MPRGPYATRLRFDPRYHDSIMGPPPYSQATLRQRMILDQLTRLRWVRQGDSLGTCAARPDTAQVRQRTGGEAVLLPSGRFAWDTAARYTFYPNCAAELARIRRVVRVLEAQERTAPVRASKRLASGYSAPQAHPPRVHLLQTNARDMVARYGCRIGELTVTALYQQHAETGDIAGSPAIVVQQRAPGPGRLGQVLPDANTVEHGVCRFKLPLHMVFNEGLVDKQSFETFGIVRAKVEQTRPVSLVSVHFYVEGILNVRERRLEAWIEVI